MHYPMVTALTVLGTGASLRTLLRQQSTGMELYFFDPSWNRLELRGPTWEKGMPEPPFEEIAIA